MSTRKLVLPVEVEWQPEGVYYAECSLIPGCHAEAETLGEVLRFGLPRVPHGLAQQVVGPTTDSFLMRVLLSGPGELVAKTMPSAPSAARSAP